MVTDYKLVRGGVNNMSEFEQQIKQLIAIGWQPHGALQYLTVDKQHVLVQALTLTTNYGTFMEK